MTIATDALMAAILNDGTAKMKLPGVVVTQCPETGYHVGHLPGFPGAHSQGETLDELRANLEEVLLLLRESEGSAPDHGPA